MNRRNLLGMLAVALAMAGATLAADRVKEKGTKEKGTKGHDSMHIDKCARACTDCMLECESCAHHCAHLVAAGKKEHQRTLGTCTDCAVFCALAAKIVAHHGPMAVPACEACAKACDTCGDACEKVGEDDAHMNCSAKACRDCAKACREMVKHAGHNHDKTEGE